MPSLCADISHCKDVVHWQSLLNRETHVRDSRYFIRLNVARVYVDCADVAGEWIERGQVTERKSTARRPSPGCIDSRTVRVRHFAAGVVIVVTLHAVVEEAGAGAKYQITLAADIPRHVESRHPLHGHVRQHALRNFTSSSQLVPIRLGDIAAQKCSCSADI